MTIAGLFALLACGPARDTGDASSARDTFDSPTIETDTNTADSDTSTATGCITEGPVLAVTAAPTVANLEWATSAPGIGSVAWGYAPDALVHVTGEESLEGSDHAIQLVGAAPETTVWWVARSHGSDGLCESEPAPWEVTAADWDEAPFSVTTTAEGFTPGFRLVPVGALRDGPPPPEYVVLVDDLGRVVWSWTVPDRFTLSDLHFEPGGQSFLGLAVAFDIEDEPGAIHRVRFDRAEEEVMSAPFAHHGLDVHEDGRIAWLAAEARYVEGEDGAEGVTVAGDVVMEMGPHGEDPEQVFSGWDQWVPDLAQITLDDEPSYPTWEDWTHANGLHVRPDRGYLVSFHLLDAVVALHPGGAYRWMMSGDRALYPGDFTFLGTIEELFTQQHSAVDVDGGILLFDNGAPNTWSEAAEFFVDESALTFQRAWHFDRDETLSTEPQGDVQRLETGNTLVTWSSNGLMTEVNSAGEIVWELAAADHEFAFTEHVATLGGPVP